MEVLASFLVGIVAETARSLGTSVGSNFKSTVRWRSNVRELEKETDHLVQLSSEVRRRLETAQKNGRPGTTKVNEWLKDVEQLILKAEALRSRIESNTGKRCAHCSGARIRFGGAVARTLDKAREKIEDGKFPDGLVSSTSLPVVVEYIPGPAINDDQTTASTALKELKSVLENDMFRRIGVWGMGGVGKTTLVKTWNNKLKNGKCLKQPFSVVIWATVSKELDVKRVQLQIAERLNVPVRAEESVEAAARRLHQRLEEEERFLLVLDDVWAKIDLDLLGIPQNDDVLEKGSKIIVISRFLEVCRAMMTDVEVKVNVLSDVEAWKLFCRNAGEVASSNQIRPFAEAVCRECCGLPLAVVATGAAMRGKTMAKLWKHALNELQRSVPFVGGIKSQVYNNLKLSYDSLEGDKTRDCFLYCALFPEDFSIEVSELARCWAVEGLVDESHGFEDSLHRAITSIEALKDSCLLEDGDREGTVKMHDVVRDVAIWIASSLEDGSAFLVRAGIGLSEISPAELSDSLGRVTFMNNKISNLPECEMQCRNASTLLLQGNLLLENVPEMFLRAFRALKVLNISSSRVRSLPSSLLDLRELRALLLHGCFFLEELPAIGALSKLQVLDLCATRIRELPREFEELTSLKQVNLSRTHYLERIFPGIVSKWVCLEVLDMSLSRYHWGLRGNTEEDQASFEELGSLKRLFSLSVRLRKIPSLSSDDPSWITRLKRFQFFIGATANSLPSRHDKRRVTMSGLDLSGEWIGGLLVTASSLVLNNCRGLDETLQDLAIYSTENYLDLSSVHVASFMGLKSLTIASSNDIIKQCGCPALYDLMPNLEELHLHGLANLTSISELVGHLGLMFSKLRLLEVARCPKMKSLILYGNLIVALPSLETIRVSSCEKLEELFSYTSVQSSATEPVAPKLRVLELKSLPKVKSLCRKGETWPMLEQVYVSKCNLLNNLPIDVENGIAITDISGESQWWGGLNWSSPSTETALQKYFRPIGIV